MNPIQKALDLIKFEIPPQILRAFLVNKTLINRHQNVNIDENIMSRVIRPRCLVDCSLVGGAEINIELHGLQAIIVDPVTTVYHIPKERTQGRSITRPMSISYVPANTLATMGNQIPTCGVTAIGTAASALLDSQKPPPLSGTARVRLVGENVIEVIDTMRLASYGSLRAIIANDDNMSHLQPASYYDFALLCLHAVKAYIYNENTIEIDIGQIHSGAALGKIRDIVDSYADAGENYQTFLETRFTKVQVLNDATSTYRIIKGLVGGYR